MSDLFGKERNPRADTRVLLGIACCPIYLETTRRRNKLANRNFQSQPVVYMAVKKAAGVALMGGTRDLLSWILVRKMLSIRSIYGHKKHLAGGHGPPDVS